MTTPATPTPDAAIRHISAAYMARDPSAFKRAVFEWERFAIAAFEDATK